MGASLAIRRSIALLWAATRPHRFEQGVKPSSRTPVTHVLSLALWHAQVMQKGELQACHEFCPCSECLLGRHTSCELKAEMGIMHRVAVPWLAGPPLRQLEELGAWGEMLRSDMIVAYTADAAEVHLEGSYWLAHIVGRAFPVPESQVHE